MSDSGKENDVITILETINENDRYLRGGTFHDQPSEVRSANRYWDTPSYRDAYIGFRPARTLP